MDKETIIKGCENWVNNHKGEDLSLTYSSIVELLAVLKEQDAVKPKCKERMGGFVAGLCPTCGTVLNNILNIKACGKCGQAVKWE
jgi:ribosomal protein S27AE